MTHGTKPKYAKQRVYAARRYQAHPIVCQCESPICPFPLHGRSLTIPEIRRRIGAEP